MTELQTQAQAVLDLLREGGWIQGTFLWNGAHCIEGAMRKALDEDHAQPLHGALRTALGVEDTCLTAWNDHPDRTWADIEAVLTTLITQSGVPA